MMVWCRAFAEGDPERILDVLLNGDTPHPDPMNGTRQNEALLGISPPHVYYYLGRTNQQFGDAAGAYYFEAATGTVSPFDTGGLLRKIPPVRDWREDACKREFLAEYSWSASEVSSLVRQYPWTDDAALARYLDGERPTQRGPHEVWGRGVWAPIWADSEFWPAWTWECRVPVRGFTGERLWRWTCTELQFERLRAYVEEHGDESLIEKFAAIVERFERGGTSVMVGLIRRFREAA